MKLIYKSRLDETFRKSASKVLSKYQRTATMILTSVALLFAAGNYGYAQYCASSAIFTGDEVISNVTLSSINNSSICGATAPGAGSAANLYSNFTGITAPNLTVGNSYPMSVTVATCGGWYGTYTNVYIDWNGDQDFLDANETVYTGAYTAAAATMTFNVVVPAGATPGVTRMRVVHVESSAPASCGTYYYGETEDYNVNVVASSACSGTPTGGATVTSNASPCPSTSYSLSLSGASTASGITYQWQSSPNGVTYTNIAGATSSFYNTTASTSAYYQCVLTCTASSSSATSTPVQVTVSSFINCYCTSNATSTADEEILNVSLATMSNTSSCGSTGGAGSVNSQYSNFTNAIPAVAIPNLTQGFSYPLSVQIGTCGGNYSNMTKVWIDYNQNGLFTDPGEQVYVSPTYTAGPHTESTTILIPATALPGNTRMRVVTVETTVATSVNPCGTYTWGETEDYFVNIAIPLAIDAGISAWVSPTMPTCSFTDSMMVTLTNYGSDTLTNCTINWSHNGVTSTSPYFWTGSLPQFGTTTVNIGYVAYGGGDSFSAWTSLPNLTVESPSGAYNDQSDLNNLIAGLSGTYTIGGSAPDFPDMASAISVLNLSGVCGPTIFDIRSDTYFEQFELSSVIGMSATNTVTFRAETGNRDDVVFDFSPSTLANNYVARLNGGDYYILEHMTLRNSAATYGRVVDVKAGADYNTFSDLVLNTVTSNSTSNYMAVIYSGDGSNDKFNTFDGCQILGGGYGAYWFGSGSASLEQGTTFTNNDFENNYYMGLYSYYQNGATYNHNHLFGTSTYTSRYGMYLGYNQNGVQVNYNTIEGSATSYFYIGMYIYYSDATPTSNGLISNNSIAVGNASTTTNTMYGLYHYYSGFNNVYNNSINVNGGSASSMAAYLYSGGANNVKNNNFVTSGLGYAMYLYGAYTLNSSNNNNFKTNGTSPFYYNANIATLAAWQAALGHDANSIMVDPGYYSVFDLHVCSDSLNGMGAVVALVTDDMDGQARNATTPDIGSDEFAPLTQAGFLGADMDLCTGDSIVLSAGAPADAILWSTNDTTTTTVVSAPGTYNVSVIGACGVSFDTIVVNQSNLVYTGYLVADTTVFCTGGSVLLTSSMLADTYSWTGGSSNDSLVVTAGGTIICNIEDACGTGTQSIVITENSAPTALFTSTPNYLTGAFTNTSTSPATGTSYLWDFGDGTTSTDVNPSHIYAIAGTYTVTLTVTNDCGTSTISHPFNTNLGLDEIAGLGTISVYPNPSNGLFNVDFNLNNELNATIKVTNVLGETICAKALGTINGLNKSAIDISTAAPGVYYVTVLSNDKTVYNNMVVKN